MSRKIFGLYWTSIFKKTSPEPNNIFLGNPPNPSHLKGRDLTGSKPPVDGLPTHRFLSVTLISDFLSPMQHLKQKSM
jgi:hypothetical protein